MSVFTTSVMCRTKTRRDFASGAPSIAEAETLQNVVAPETASGPAERSCLSIEQTAAVRGELTERSPAFVLMRISFVSETASPANFGMALLVAAVQVFAQASFGLSPLSAV